MNSRGFETGLKTQKPLPSEEVFDT